MGILVNDPGISPAAAGGLARTAKAQYAPRGKWSKMQVAVFTNRDAARIFLRYQAKRKNARLEEPDFQDLGSQGVWSGAVAFYESDGGGEKTFQPSKSPQNWWTSRGS